MNESMKAWKHESFQHFPACYFFPLISFPFSPAEAEKCENAFALWLQGDALLGIYISDLLLTLLELMMAIPPSISFAVVRLCSQDCKSHRAKERKWARAVSVSSVLPEDIQWRCSGIFAVQQLGRIGFLGLWTFISSLLCSSFSINAPDAQ